MQSERDAVQQALTAVQSERDAVQQALTAMQSERDAAVTALQQERNSAQSEIGRMNGNYARVTKRMKEQSKELEAVRTETQELAQAHAKTQASEAELKQKLKKMGQEHDHAIKKLASTRRDLEERLKDAETIAAAKQTTAALKLAEAEAAAAEAREAAKYATALTDETTRKNNALLVKNMENAKKLSEVMDIVAVLEHKAVEAAKEVRARIPFIDGVDDYRAVDGRQMDALLKLYMYEVDSMEERSDLIDYLTATIFAELVSLMTIFTNRTEVHYEIRQKIMDTVTTIKALKDGVLHHLVHCRSAVSDIYRTAPPKSVRSVMCKSLVSSNLTDAVLLRRLELNTITPAEYIKIRTAMLRDAEASRATTALQLTTTPSLLTASSPSASSSATASQLTSSPSASSSPTAVTTPSLLTSSPSQALQRRLRRTKLPSS
jgi:myosin heavy subunit